MTDAEEMACEVAKAVAGMVAASAVFVGSVLAVSGYMQRTQAAALSQFPPGTVITIPPAAKP